MPEENKDSKVPKKNNAKISKKGWIGLGLIIISLLVLNSFASNPPYEDEEQAIIFMLSLLLFFILFTGIILFFLGSKGCERKLILILVILFFIPRIVFGIQLLYPPDYIIKFIFNEKEIVKLEKEAINTKNPEKCFFEINKIPLISYFLAPPEVEIDYVFRHAAPRSTECVTNIAIIREDASICETLEDKKFILRVQPGGGISREGSEGYRAQCYQEVFLISETYKEDILSCRKETRSGHPYIDGECIEGIAFKRDDMELCNINAYREPCIRGITFSRNIPDNDPAKCEEIVEERIWDQSVCLMALAVKTGDIRTCNQVEGLGWKNRCIDALEKFGQQVLPKEEEGEIVYLGIRYRIINKEIQEENNLPADYGAWVTGEASSGDLEKISLKDGDIILEFNNEKITPQNYLAKILTKYSPGDKVILKILRGTEEKNIEVILEGKNK